MTDLLTRDERMELDMLREEKRKLLDALATQNAQLHVGLTIARELHLGMISEAEAVEALRRWSVPGEEVARSAQNMLIASCEQRVLDDLAHRMQRNGYSDEAEGVRVWARQWALRREGRA
jgi:hypothetical protein